MSGLWNNLLKKFRYTFKRTRTQFSQIRNMHSAGSATQKPNRYNLLLMALVAPVALYLTAPKNSKAQDRDEASDLKAQKEIQADMKADTKSGVTPVYRIVLTGGPCGGKSTAMAMISDRLMSLGFRVFRVPEAATLLITGTGVQPLQLQEAQRTVFEGSIVKTKIALEDIFYAIAKSGTQPAVIICDRGTMDTRAYMHEAEWEVLMDDFGWNTVDLRDKRYDAVVHLVTAAIGAEKFYTTENNAARSETLNEARDLDFKILNSWVGHPRLRIIDNSTDFKSKIKRVEDVICQIVGAPRPIWTERKFVVSSEIPIEVTEKLGIKLETFHVEQNYLQKTNPRLGGYNYVRRRGQNGNYTYTHSMVRRASDGNLGSDPNAEVAILERAVSGREYVALLKNGDPNRITVMKKVQCFLWNNVYYELQTFVKPDIGLTILRTEIEPTKEINFPWFLQIKGEITGASEFSSYYISEHYKDTPSGLQWKQNQEMLHAFSFMKEKITQKQKQSGSMDE